MRLALEIENIVAAQRTEHTNLPSHYFALLNIASADEVSDITKTPPSYSW